MALMTTNKLKIAILGSGKIGTDLLIKSMRSPYLDCKLFIGRDLNSEGMLKAKSIGVAVSDKSINAIIENPDCCDLVFDATSALAHKHHAEVLKSLNKKVIDLTPAKIGKMCIPAINNEEILTIDNVNMVSCGGQASIPIAYAVGLIHSDIDYIEVVSTISSYSAGLATRQNLDEYIDTTEYALKHFVKCNTCKTILNLNPAEPCINMKTTLFFKIKKPNIEQITRSVDYMVKTIKRYVPGYELIVPPSIEAGRLVIMIQVQGQGDFLPQYAGNLDIINCAAIVVAEEYAKSKIHCAK